MVLFDVGLRSDDSTRPFLRQLPFFNWFYPFVTEDAHLSGHLSALSSINWASIQRRAAYFHIPFCETVCTFCPFIRGAYRSQDEVRHYVSALRKEVKLKASYLGRLEVDCIFIGGGTPSVLANSEIDELGMCIDKYLDTRRVTEFTVEVEVKSVTYQKLLALKGIGVNRISFGVQTFSPSYRRAFHLDAEISQIENVAAWVHELFPYTNVDMIYGIAGQAVEDAVWDAERAIKLHTTTIDFYPLNNLAAQARMHRNLHAQGMSPRSAAERMEHRRTIDWHMQSRGYSRINGYGYAANPEPSTGVAQVSPKFVYHDILYGHHDDAILGYGAGAISQVPGFNFLNTGDRRDYASCVLGGVLPFAAYSTDGSPEKGVVTFP